MAIWGPRLLSTTDAAKLADLAGAKYDLESAVSFCDELAALYPLSPNPQVLTDALSTAIAVRYARCFTTGVRARLTEEVLVQLPEDLRAIHEYLRLVRDKYIAHSVNSLEENHVTVHVKEPPDPPALGGIGTLQARTQALSFQDTRRVRELCQAVGAAVDRLMEEQKSIVRRQVESLPLEEIYELPEPPAYVPDWARIHSPRRRT